MPGFSRRELIGVALVTGVTLGLAWAMPRPVSPGFHGRYWQNLDWSGSPVAESHGAMPTGLDVMRRLPGASRGGSAEWAGFYLVDVPGRYEFELVSDDGAWLSVGEALLIDNGGVHAARAIRGALDLRDGHVPMRVRYFQAGGDLVLQIYQTGPDGARRRLSDRDVVMTRQVAEIGRWLPAWRAVAVAIPVAWAGLFLYLPVRVAAHLIGRSIVRLSPAPVDRGVLVAVMVVGAGLAGWGLDWGLVGGEWAADELPSAYVRDLIDCRLAGGWFDKYPWMHYAVLAIPISAFKLAGSFGILAVESLASQAAQLAVMRAVSTLMGVGAIGAIYVCGAELGGPRVGLSAALTLVLTPLFAYYGGVANLDVPALFWFGWAMAAFIRVVKRQERADYAWLGVLAAAAVATKDQAYANLALVVPAVIWVTAATKPQAAWWGRLAAVLVDGRVLLAGAAAAAGSLLFHNMLFNAGGFVAHIRVLRTFDDLGVVPSTLGGYVSITGLTAALFRFALGWPVLLLAIAGIARALRTPARRWWLWLLVVPLSFQLTFTWVTLYVNDRYLFGGVFVLALFAGSAAADLLAVRRWRALAAAAVVLTFAHAALRAASIDVMMTVDSRRAVRAWIHADAPDGAAAGMLGQYLPELGGPVEPFVLQGSIAAVSAARPRYVVLNDRFAQRFHGDRAPETQALVAALADGSLGYEEVLRYRTPLPFWVVLGRDREFQRREESVLTNLDKVNPEIVVYRRRD